MKTLTLNLFVRERRDRDEVKLGCESLVKPIKMLVSPGHLDIVELQPKMSPYGYFIFLWSHLH